jgi:O-antigen/teichoic acid export membrane protein
MRGKSVLRNFSQALSASMATAIVAAVSLLVLPKVLGVEQFAYWQLYLFYVTYVGILHFGWADGAYLRYGGKYYDDLDKKSMNGQFWLLTIMETLIMILISLWALNFVDDANRAIIVIFAGVNCLLLNTRAFLQFTLQGTGRIKEFARNVVLEKVLFVILAIVGLLMGMHTFEYFLAVDVLAKLIMLLSLMILCKDIVFKIPRNGSGYLSEVLSNISSGSKLLLAGVASLLIVGIFRLAIEYKWDLVTFGKVSLVLSVTSILMILINAASVAIFPAIKRATSKNQNEIYKTLRIMLMAISLGFLVFYYPLYLVLSVWLPEYKDALVYLSILLPLCIYETKNQFLINTYMKAYRKERLMMTINLISLVLAGLVVFVTAFIMHSLPFVLFGLLLTIAFRATLSELFLQKTMKINPIRDISYEFILVVIFLLAGIFIGGWWGMSFYFTTYCMYIFIKKNEIIGSVELILNRKR